MCVDWHNDSSACLADQLKLTDWLTYCSWMQSHLDREVAYSVTDWINGTLADWLIQWLVNYTVQANDNVDDRFTYWLEKAITMVKRPTYWLTGWLLYKGIAGLQTDWLTDILIGWLVDLSLYRLTLRRHCWTADWLTDWLIGWLIDCCTGWLD